MLTRARFAGFKSLFDVRVELEPFTVLVGPNGCGKSSVLQALYMTLEASRWDGTSSHVFSRGGEIISGLGPDRLCTQGASVPLVASVGDAAGNTFTVTVAPGAATRWHEGIAFEVGTREGVKALKYPLELSERDAFGEHLSSALRWSVLQLAMVPRAIAAPSDMLVNELRADGYGLPTVLRDLAANHPDAYKAVLDDMRLAVRHFRGVRWKKKLRSPDDPSTSPAPLDTLQLVMTNGTIAAADCSGGTLLALATLTAVHHPDLPSVLLIDDIDHGLHLGAQYQLVQAIRRQMAARPELQVICTTHSPILVDAFEAREVRVLRLDDTTGRTYCRPLTDAPEFARWRRGLQAGELWATLGEDWVSDDHAG